LKLPSLAFSSSGVLFNPLCLPVTKRGVSSTRLGFGQQPRAASAAEFSRQDSYGRRRGRSIEQPVPSTSGRSGLPNSNTSRSPSLGLFVERTKNAIHWSSKRPRPRAIVIEKRLQRSLTGDRLQAPGTLKHKAPVLPVPAWQLSFPHVAVATLTSVLFGYHIGVVNVPLQYIARDLGFSGNALIQGFVVSICLVGAFMGCAASGIVADKYGRRRAFQLSSVPMICGALFR
jgi:hypothetical protein